MSETKIFVGNIPFDATSKEFTKCFESSEGFVSADLMLTRGFGFVTYKNKFFCENLIKNNDSYIRNRRLRLSLYDQPKKTVQEKIYIKLENINEYITRDEIKKEFDNFCKTGICFIDRNRETGDFLTTGLIELFDKDVAQQLLNLGTIIMPDSSEIFLKSYDDKSEVKVTNTNTNTNRINRVY
jgi:RNA recognition motif-containing protein